MSHHTVKKGYQDLVERLNKHPQGAPPSKLLFQILEMLFSEKEAELVSSLPIKPFTVKQAARVWKMKEAEAQKILDELASRAILVDLCFEDRTLYALPPPMAGFFEFSMMRIRDDIDQKALGELYYQYMNQEEDFIRDLMNNGETQLGRIFVNEQALSTENAMHILDYERASEVIKTASHIGVGMCYCRHKMQHVGKACDAPMDICTTFNTSAAALIRHGFARQIDVSEAMDLLDQAQSHNLVQFGSNVRNEVNFICHCCGCCCEALIATRKFAIEDSFFTSNYIPRVDEHACVGCGKCAKVCPVDAMVLETTKDKSKAKLHEGLCLGCGVCVRVCPSTCIKLESKEQRVVTPVNTAHNTILMAIERGKLQNLIFDKQAYKSHRLLAAVFKVILKLPPLKQMLASKQMKSRYLDKLLSGYQV